MDEQASTILEVTTMKPNLAHEIKVDPNSAVKSIDDAPLPLMRAQTPPIAFPIDALGPVLSPAASAIHGLTGAPVAVCGTSILAAGSLVAMAYVDVMPPYGNKPRPSSLFCCSIAESGDRKTMCDSYALEPLEIYRKELSQTYADLYAEYENKLKAWEKSREMALKPKGGDASRSQMERALGDLGKKPSPPPEPIITCGEPTIEGLHGLCCTGQGFVGLFTDEGGGFAGGHAMNADNRTKTISHLSKLWDGAPIDRIRKGEGNKVWYGRRLAIHLMVQPIIAGQIFSDDLLKGQGFLSRFLVCHPESTAGTREFREISHEHLSAIESYKTHILRLLRRPRQHAELDYAELTPRVLHLSPEARELWIEFYNANERALSPDSPLSPIKWLAAKMPENALRVAAVLTEINHPGSEAIGIDCMLGAIDLVKFYTSEALRIFDAGVMDPDLMTADKALEFIREKGGEIHLAQLYQQGPRKVRNAKDARRILGILADHSHVERLESGKEIDGAMRREVWRLRP
jgi:hypothetical protein